MIDLSRYQRLKPRGLSWIERVGNDIYLKFKRFSVEDGSEITDEPEQWLVERDKIEAARDKAAQFVSDADGFLKDLEGV
jgi:hypothetical protein